jgi:hypothetical protein
LTPEKIHGETVKQLQETFLAMTSPEWDLALEGKPPGVRKKAANLLLSTQEARVRLENAELTQIRDKLLENEEALQVGRQQVMQSLERIQEIETVLKTVSSFIGIVARVVPLL